MIQLDVTWKKIQEDFYLIVHSRHLWLQSEIYTFHFHKKKSSKTEITEYSKNENKNLSTKMKLKENWENEEKK